MKNLYIILIFVFMTLTNLPLQGSLNEQIEKALSISKDKLNELAKRKGPWRFVAYTDTVGKWDGQRSFNWCSGFPAGLMWMMYDYTGDEVWATYGRDWTDAIKARATATDNDTGFQIYCSYGYGLRYGSKALSESEKADYLKVIKTGNQTFTTQRYNQNVGGYRSWPSRAADPYLGRRFEINIDEMMNLELPIYVAKQSRDASLMAKVISHADLTWKNNVFKEGDSQWTSEKSPEYVRRRIGSTWHVAAYNPKTGILINKRTEQGDRDESTWSRGQSWAIYGYTMLYRYTQEPRMLERAEICFDYFMSALKSQSKDFIAYSDFDAPLDEKNPRDASASAVVASAAIELYQFTQDRKYLEAAENILNSLTRAPYLIEDMEYESILTRSSIEYDNHKEVGAIFGDFYFVEAILRYRELKSKEGGGC